MEYVEASLGLLTQLCNDPTYTRHSTSPNSIRYRTQHTLVPVTKFYFWPERHTVPRYGLSNLDMASGDFPQGGVSETEIRRGSLLWPSLASCISHCCTSAKEDQFTRMYTFGQHLDQSGATATNSVLSLAIAAMQLILYTPHMHETLQLRQYL